jgi:hypothetical protein
VLSREFAIEDLLSGQTLQLWSDLCSCNKCWPVTFAGSISERHWMTKEKRIILYANQELRILSLPPLAQSRRVGRPDDNEPILDLPLGAGEVEESFGVHSFGQD